MNMLHMQKSVVSFVQLFLCAAVVQLLHTSHACEEAKRMLLHGRMKAAHPLEHRHHESIGSDKGLHEALK